MERILERFIGEEAKKHIERYHKYHNSLHIECKRIEKRLILHKDKEIKIPNYWNIDKKHNPFYVLKNRKAIAKSITKKIKEQGYTPNIPYIFKKQKKDGGTRPISIFQIHDAAISNYYYKRLLSKNKHRFSSFSYAYRDDRNVHFAIQDIALELKKKPRMFIAEFDFSKFFDTIDHTFLLKQLLENGFLISKDEEYIINSFLNIQEKKMGIPQGTSLSLFLANVTCWQLDRKLENLGLRFARYADDTLIWSNDYNKILKAFDVIEEFSKEAKVKINYSKSEGISLLAAKGIPIELIKNKEYVNFLGYKITSNSIGIKDESILKIKERITSILYQNLLFPLKKHNNMKTEIKENYDRDYFIALSQIRRYLYGDLTDKQIDRYKMGQIKKLVFKGIMSFYLLVDDRNQLKELDSWLRRTIISTLNLRKRYLKTYEIQVSDFPYNLTYKNIVNMSLIKDPKNGTYRIPSFLKIRDAIEIGLKNEGIIKIMNPKADLYIYNQE